MPASPLDSALYRGLFGDDHLARLFSDSAEIRAWLLVEGALAKAQGALGLIPADSAAFLHRACLEVQIDPAALSAQIGRDADPIPALVAVARKALEAPPHAEYLHHHAASGDIADTALALRLRQALALIEAHLVGLIKTLGRTAEKHADTAIGAQAAAWGTPLADLLARLDTLRPCLLTVTLCEGMGAETPALRAALVEALRLADPIAPDPGRIAELAGWLSALTGDLARIGAESDATRTVPLSALARQAEALDAALQTAGTGQPARLIETLALPQLVIGTGAVTTARAAEPTLLATLPPAPAAARAFAKAAGALPTPADRG